MVVVAARLPTLARTGALARKMALHCGDITKCKWRTLTAVEIDAIVNAANPTLLGGGGVDGAIHRAANDARFLEECRSLNGCRTGEAKTTSAYQLPCRYVIHTVGPICMYELAKGPDREHSEDEARSLLQAAYRHSLQQAVQWGARSLVRERQLTQAFPSISTGVYGYPKEAATHAAVETVTQFLQEPQGEQIDLVVFCCFSPGDLALYERIAPLYAVAGGR